MEVENYFVRGLRVGEPRRLFLVEGNAIGGSARQRRKCKCCWAKLSL
jgi:hypothetical protein